MATTRVRGTKNPERAGIFALAPDLVTANREQNRKLVSDRLLTWHGPSLATARADLLSVLA